MADMLILSRVGGSAPCIVLEVYHLLPIIPTGIIVCDKQYIEKGRRHPPVHLCRVRVVSRDVAVARRCTARLYAGVMRKWL
jgi:hypothetical protein